MLSGCRQQSSSLIGATEFGECKMLKCLKNLIAIVVILGMQSEVHPQESPIASSNDRFASKLELLCSKIEALENRINLLEKQLARIELAAGAVGFSDGFKRRTAAEVDQWIRTRGIEAAHKAEAFQRHTWISTQDGSAFSAFGSIFKVP